MINSNYLFLTSIAVGLVSYIGLFSLIGEMLHEKTPKIMVGAWANLFLTEISIGVSTGVLILPTCDSIKCHQSEVMQVVFFTLTYTAIITLVISIAMFCKKSVMYGLQLSCILLFISFGILSMGARLGFDMTYFKNIPPSLGAGVEFLEKNFLLISSSFLIIATPALITLAALKKY